MFSYKSTFNPARGFVMMSEMIFVFCALNILVCCKVKFNYYTYKTGLNII